MKKLSGTLPWTKSCFVCGEENPHGLHLRSRIEDGKVVLDYTTRASDVGYRELVHGGIGMTLLDEVMTWAAIVDFRRMCVAAEIKVRLKAPISVGHKLRAESWVAKSTGRLCVTEGALIDEDGVTLMSSEGKYVPMSEDQAALSEKDFVVSPDVIDPKEIVGR